MIGALLSFYFVKPVHAGEVVKLSVRPSCQALFHKPEVRNPERYAQLLQVNPHSANRWKTLGDMQRATPEVFRDKVGTNWAKFAQSVASQLTTDQVAQIQRYLSDPFLAHNPLYATQDIRSQVGYTAADLADGKMRWVTRIDINFVAGFWILLEYDRIHHTDLALKTGLACLGMLDGDDDFKRDLLVPIVERAFLFQDRAEIAAFFHQLEKISPNTAAVEQLPWRFIFEKLKSLPVATRPSSEVISRVIERKAAQMLTESLAARAAHKGAPADSVLSDSFRLEKVPEQVEELATLGASYFRSNGDEAAASKFDQLNMKAITIRAGNMGVPVKSLLAHLELFTAHCGPVVRKDGSPLVGLENLRVERGGVSGWQIAFEDIAGKTQLISVFGSDPKFGYQFSGHLDKTSFYLSFVNDNQIELSYIDSFVNGRSKAACIRDHE